MIYNPLEEFNSKFRDLHKNNTTELFDSLVERSGINVEENRLTVKKYEEAKEGINTLKKKLNLKRFLRVLMIITIVLIPLVILRTTPKIKALRKEIEEADKRAEELLDEAKRQVYPLIALFNERQSLDIIEKTVPDLAFAPCFSAEQESNMTLNFDFCPTISNDISTLDVLAGSYNENPFVFENKLIHRMGIEVYHGYKTISWTETYRDSDGKMRTRRRTETLHATVTKPKPFYSTQIVLSYCSQGGPELSFTRDAEHINEKSDKAIERHIKKGEKKLKKMTDDAIKNNSDFMSMSNSDFEVLFDALDRTNEVQYRTLFTPLAQTNMVDLILSDDTFGDDFDFIKERRTNKIITKHSQGRSLTLRPAHFTSHSYDVIRESFINKNSEFFKAIYFDFAPLLAIPMYQERPVHSLDPIPDYSRLYSYMECESLANAADPKRFVHRDTKTQAILKSEHIGKVGDADKIAVSAYSYDIEKRVDFVPTLGGDGRIHSVPVPWDEYIALENTEEFFVAAIEAAKGKSTLAIRNHLCIYN